MSFAYKGTLTVDHTKVPSTQTSFPVLVSLTDATLKTVGNGGQVQDTNGYDIRFFSDSNLTVPVNFELESYVATTGAIVFWVSIASLSSSSNTVFYMGYGDAALNTNASSTSTWDSDYVLVAHLPNGTTLSAADSTSNANNGTNDGGSAIAGKIDGGVSFPAGGSNSKIQFGSPASLGGITAKTMSFWVNPQDDPNTFGVMLTISLGIPILMQISHQRFGGPDDKIFFASAFNTTDGHWESPNGSLPTGSWAHVVITYNNSSTSNDPLIYINGSSQTVTETQAPAGALGDDSTFNWVLGSRDNDASKFKGYIDEVRISKVIRAADWITTEYNNQSSPSTFLSASYGAFTAATTIPVFMNQYRQRRA